ncbi:MAG: type secretion system protein [Caulobacter sp.]|nr:type secretion system protein [Caulobacter sp.]
MLVILAAVLGFITIAGLGWALAGGESGETRAAKRAHALVRLSPETVAAQAKAVANTPDARRKQILKVLKEQDRRQKKASLTIAARLRQAGLGDSARPFWIVSGVISLVVAAVLLLFGQSPLLALGGAFAAGGGLPRWVVGLLARARTRRFTSAFPDAVDILVRGIRSGLPVHDCLKVIGKECQEPLAGEFRSLTENTGMGMSMDQALERMYERMPTSELRFFTIVLAIQAKTGGNLAEALANLSLVLRSRRLMHEKIKALSAEAVASAVIIGCLPPAVVVLISVTAPDYMKPLFTDPRGHLMLLGSGVWMTIGILVMRKMINFRF